MIGRMRISWRLARATLQVLRLNTDLLIFPIVGLIAVSLVLALMMGGILALADFQVGVLMQAPIWARFTATFFFYLVGYFIVFSANTAMVGVAMLLLDGKQATFADGWRIAYTHRGSIFAYALLAATAGVFLRLLTRWIGQSGRFVVPVVQRVVIFSAFNLAWHVVPVLVIPVLIAEKRAPLDAIRRSSQLVTQRWGEGVVQNANVWLIFMLPMLVTIVAGIGAVIWAGQSLQETWITAVLYLVVMLIAMMFLLATGLNDICSAITYRYAAAMPIPIPFEQELLSQTFRARPSRILRFVRRGWSRLAHWRTGR
ncbi:MAG: hypothetical protein IT328_13620 [Caldilineaceae bacterium]|nr:hypothetical protein [Caldilineaceae bacterium]